MVRRLRKDAGPSVMEYKQSTTVMPTPAPLHGATLVLGVAKAVMVAVLVAAALALMPVGGILLFLVWVSVSHGGVGAIPAVHLIWLFGVVLAAVGLLLTGFLLLLRWSGYRRRKGMRWRRCKIRKRHH